MAVTDSAAGQQVIEQVKAYLADDRHDYVKCRQLLASLAALLSASPGADDTMTTIVIDKDGKSKAVTFKRTLPDPGCPELDALTASSASPETQGLIEKHARLAVLQGQNQGDSYRPTPEEANLLVNMRFILRKFAAELAVSGDRGVSPQEKK